MNILKMTVVFLVVLNIVLAFYVIASVGYSKMLVKKIEVLQKENAWRKKAEITCWSTLDQTEDLLENRTVLLKLHKEK